MSIKSTPHIVNITDGSLVGKLLRHGSAYFISSAILNFTTFLLVPVNTRIFSETEYGTIATINAVYKLAGIFIGLYLYAAYSVFYHEYKSNPQALRRYTSTIFWFIVAWGSSVATLGLLLTKAFFIDISGWSVLTLAFSVSLLNQLSLVGISYLQQNHRSILLASLNLTNLFLHVLIMLTTVTIFDLGLTGKYIGLLSGAGVSALISGLVLYREGLLGLQFSGAMLKESLLFSVLLMPNIAAGWITNLSDRILLTLYGTLAETGIYSIGYGLGRSIMLFSMPISRVYGPTMFALLKKNPENAKTRIEHFIPYFFMFMLWVYMALALFAKEIVTLMTTKNYVSASAIVPVVLFAYFLGSQYIPFTNILNHKRKTWVISSGAILQASFNLGANLIFIPFLGKMAAAWTTVISMAIYTAWMFFWSQRTFYLQLDYKRILTAGVITGIAKGIATVLTPLPFFAASYAATIGLKASLLLGILAAMWISGCILSVDKRRIKDRILKVKRTYLDARSGHSPLP